MVLIVDNDRLIRATLGQGLRNTGFDIVESSSGPEVLRICDIDRPDLVLLEARMPGMAALDVGRVLRDRAIPFVILSTSSDWEMVDAAAKQGAYGYLVKPVEVSQVAAAIHTALFRAGDLQLVSEYRKRLTNALARKRETSMAVGLIMERYRLNAKDGFETLRSLARSQRRQVQDLAIDLVRAADSLNQLLVRKVSGIRDKPKN